MVIDKTTIKIPQDVDKERDEKESRGERRNYDTLYQYLKTGSTILITNENIFSIMYKINELENRIKELE